MWNANNAFAFRVASLTGNRIGSIARTENNAIYKSATRIVTGARLTVIIGVLPSVSTALHRDRAANRSRSRRTAGSRIGVKSFPSIAAAAATGWCRQNRCYIRRARLTVVVTTYLIAPATFMRRACVRAHGMYRIRRLSPIIIVHRRVGGLVRAWVSCAARVVGTGDGRTRPAVRPVFLTCFTIARTRTHTRAHAHRGFLETAALSKDARVRLTARGPSLNHGRSSAVLPARHPPLPVCRAPDRRTPVRTRRSAMPGRRDGVESICAVNSATKWNFPSCSVVRVFHFAIVQSLYVHCATLYRLRFSVLWTESRVGLTCTWHLCATTDRPRNIITEISSGN